MSRLARGITQIAYEDIIPALYQFGNEASGCSLPRFGHDQPDHGLIEGLALLRSLGRNYLRQCMPFIQAHYHHLMTHGALIIQDERGQSGWNGIGSLKSVVHSTYDDGAISLAA